MGQQRVGMTEATYFVHTHTQCYKYHYNSKQPTIYKHTKHTCCTALIYTMFMKNFSVKKILFYLSPF